MGAPGGKDRHDWQRVVEIFNAVIEAPPADREARLESLCGGDAVLRAGVARLLESDRRVEGRFLEPPLALWPPPPEAVSVHPPPTVRGAGEAPPTAP